MFVLFYNSLLEKKKMCTKELIVTEQIVCPVAYHLQKSIFTNDREERVPLIKMLAI